MLRRKLAIVTLLWALPAIVIAAGKPGISFDRTEHDYGRILYGETVKAEFKFTNTGTDTLVIEKLRSSCGCTKAVKGSREVPPNGKSKIVASFDTTGLRAGKKAKKVFVHSNDPGKPVVKLKLYAYVVRRLNIEPSSVAKTLSEFQETVTFALTAKNDSDRPITLKVSKVKGAFVQAALKPENALLKPKSDTRLDIVLKLKKEEGRHFYMGRVLLKTDHPLEKEIGLRYLIRLK